MTGDEQKQGASGPPQAGDAPPPQEKASPPPPPADRAQPLWRRLFSNIGLLPKIIGGVVALLAGIAAIYGYVRPVVSSAKLTVNATCQNHRIHIEIVNRGGRPARVGPPVFTIHSPERNNALDLRRYLVEDPGNDGIVDVDADGRASLNYRNPLNFFSEDESANACRFDLTLPVEGRTTALPGNCRCDYIR